MPFPLFALIWTGVSLAWVALAAAITYAVLT